MSVQVLNQPPTNRVVLVHTPLNHRHQMVPTIVNYMGFRSAVKTENNERIAKGNDASILFIRSTFNDYEARYLKAFPSKAPYLGGGREHVEEAQQRRCHGLAPPSQAVTA